MTRALVAELRDAAERHYAAMARADEEHAEAVAQALREARAQEATWRRAHMRAINGGFDRP